ncbi:hypothetical protein MUO32_22340 [Shinella sp. CPCC 101442]|uniref:hypothetical protein n=1 Tax=Shinella sp. CPCC 101442 TaxID=2932265 RepID=UPI00215229AE|nr:hypothetical protein [Shinella sp. CPCC 101442]MCR6501782.1 hypothetical protein [Shinella sp. CPCC 101442]
MILPLDITFVARTEMAKKTKMAQLTQSPRDKAIIVTLQAGEEAIITGVMGGCCSVVLLWNKPINTNNYFNARGHHAGGGPGNLDWDGLLDGVDTNDFNTKLVMSCAPDDYVSYIEKVKDALAGKNIKIRRAFLNLTNAVIYRTGDYADFNNLDASTLLIRKDPRPFIM